MRFAEFDFNSHPQETSENSVDVGHFGIVHGYTGVETLHEMEAHDHYLYAKYAMKRVADFVGKNEPSELNSMYMYMDWDIHL